MTFEKLLKLTSPNFGNTNFIYLEIKSLITVEHQHKSSQLMTKSFH